MIHQHYLYYFLKDKINNNFSIQKLKLNFIQYKQKQKFLQCKINLIEKV